MEDKGRAKTDNNQHREMTLRIIKTSYDSRVIYRLASHHNGRRRNDSVVSEPARRSIYSEGDVIRVLNHDRFSGPAVTSNIKSFSAVIEEGISIAEPLEDCQVGAVGQPVWSGQNNQLPKGREILFAVSWLQLAPLPFNGGLARLAPRK